MTPSVAHRARRAAAIVMAVSPPLLSACFFKGPHRWELFERSGSLTTVVGFLLATRRYLQPGIRELAARQRSDPSRSEMVELVEEVRTAKLGLAISAFGTVVWGWGAYLGWWTFSYLGAWAVIALLDVRRDLIRQRNQA